MRVAQLVIGGEVAGGQVVARRLALALRARGDEALVLVPGGGAFAELLAADGIPVREVELGRSFRLDAALRLVRVLRHDRIDLLHTHTMLPANVLARVAGRLAGVPVVSHIHIENHFHPRPAVRALQRVLDNGTARLCARILVVSEATRRALERQGVPGALMEVVRNGIEPAEGATPAGLREELGLAPGTPLVGEVGRLCAVKGQRELIEALARLERRDVRLVLVGKDLEEGGAFEAGLERRAEELGVRDRVVFAGYRPDVPAVLADLDLVALPSWVEGLPLVLLEAMAAGKPVVATPVGGTPELVVHEETGVLVPPRDPRALAAAIDALLADPERATRLAAAGREWVTARFSADGMVVRILRVYDNVTGASDERP